MAQEKSQFTDLIKQIEELSVKDLAKLVKELEERFGVSGAMIVSAPAAGAAAPAGGEAVAPTEEKTHFDVVLAAAGEQKIAVIKAVREVRSDLGLQDAKTFVESAPKTLKEKASKEEAEDIKKKLTAAGATIELK